MKKNKYLTNELPYSINKNRIILSIVQSLHFLHL